MENVKVGAKFRKRAIIIVEISAIALIDFLFLLYAALKNPNLPFLNLRTIKELLIFLLPVDILIYFVFLIINQQQQKLLAFQQKLKSINDKLEKKVKELYQLHQIGNILSSSLNFDYVLKRGLEGIASVVYVEKGVVLAREKRGKWRGKVSLGIPARAERIKLSPLKNWLVEEAVAQRQPTIFNRLEGVLFHLEGEDKKFSLMNIMTVPLFSKNKLLGVIIVGNNKIESPYLKGEVELVDVFAKEIAISLENAYLHEQVEELAITDGLTNLYNHRYFRQRFAEEFNRSRRYKFPLSLMISDVDIFKGYVDSYGHLKADRALIELGVLVKKELREIDIVARYGGDEFVYILPQTPPQQAFLVAERLKKAVESYRFEGGNGREAKLTLSIGIAGYPLHAQTAEELLKKADEALFQAKKEGRNRIEIWGSVKKTVPEDSPQPH